MIVLGIDPGIATVGFALLEKSGGGETVIIKYGTVRTPAGLPLHTRLVQISTDIAELIGMFKPDVMSVEELFFNTNVKTAIQVAHGRGVIIETGARHGLPVFEYTPLQIKQAVVGYGRAEKSQVMEMVKVLLKMPVAPKQDDAADALAVALCHIQCAGSRLR